MFHRLLQWVARMVAERPILTLLFVAAFTIVFGILAREQQLEGGASPFQVESQMAEDLETINDEFAAQSSLTSIQLIVNAGEDGNVITREGVDVEQQVRSIVLGVPEVQRWLSDDPQAMVSYADPMRVVLELQGIPLEEATDRQLADAASLAFADPEQGSVARLPYSADLDPDQGIAQAGVMLVRLEPVTDLPDVRTASLAVEDALRDEYDGAFTVDPFNFLIVNNATSEASLAEMPRLLAIGLVLILIILTLLYRRLSDVVLGLLGLVVTVIWMTGLAVFVGPDYLGLTGHFTQISVIVPDLPDRTRRGLRPPAHVPLSGGTTDRDWSRRHRRPRHCRRSGPRSVWLLSRR